MYHLVTNCRACNFGPANFAPGTKHGTSGDRLQKVFSLGVQPLANDFTTEDGEHQGFAPLEVLLCPKCGLAQLSVVVRPEILYGGHYLYVTSKSTMMQDHFKRLWDDCSKLATCKNVVEIGSNDGDFLKYCAAHGAESILGVEPAENLAEAARKAGVPTICEFFGHDAAVHVGQQMPRVGMVFARHVFCHVADWQGFMAAMQLIADLDTVICIEVPYVVDQLKANSFDQCLPPGQLIVTQRGIVEIENVTTKDSVLTHCGKFKKVSRVFENEYAGPVVSVTVYGRNIPLLLTPEHPVYVCRDGQKQFINASLLKVGDRLMKACADQEDWSWSPLFVSHRKGNCRSSTVSSFTVNDTLCKVFGFYLAEGYYYECKPNSAQVSFSFGKSNSEKLLAEECADCLEKHRAKATVRLTKYGWRVTTYGAMARLLKQEFGTGAVNKCLPGWAFSLSSQLAHVIVESYVRGDGYVYRDGKYWRASTVSIKLAEGIAVLANKLGYACSINVGKALSPRKIANNPNVSVLTNPPIDILIRRTQSKNIKTSCDGINQYGVVRSLSTLPYAGLVYNLEVEDHHSYTAVQTTVHNCYHEHLSYLSIRAVRALLNGGPFHLRKILHYPIHGGAIVLVIQRRSATEPVHESVSQYLENEQVTASVWEQFSVRCHRQIQELTRYVRQLADAGKRIVGFGASAKSTVWVNACGLTRKELACVYDCTPEKWYRYIPGTDIPIVPEGGFYVDNPDYAVLFAWNYAPEVITRQVKWREGGGKWIVPVPELRVIGVDSDTGRA